MKNISFSENAIKELSKLKHDLAKQLLKNRLSNSMNKMDGSIHINFFGKDTTNIHRINKGNVRKEDLKTSRLIKTILDNYTIPNKPSEIESIFNELKGNLYTPVIELISGDNIKENYDMNNYLYPGICDEDETFLGSLSKSCMRYPHCQEYMSFYTKNAHIVSIAIIKENNKVVSRALIWKTDCGRVLMDRVYYTNIEECYAMINWAKENNYLWADTISWNAEYDPIIKDSKGKIVDENISVTIKDDVYKHFPYLDTFSYYNIETNKLYYRMVEDNTISLIRMRFLKGNVSSNSIIRYPINKKEESLLEQYASKIPLISYKEGRKIHVNQILNLCILYPYNAKDILNYPYIGDRSHLVRKILNSKEYSLLEHLKINSDYDNIETLKEVWNNKECKQYISNNLYYLSIINTLDIINYVIDDNPLILLKNIYKYIYSAVINNNIDISLYDWLKHAKKCSDYLALLPQGERINSTTNFITNINKFVSLKTYFKTSKVYNIEGFIALCRMYSWKGEYYFINVVEELHFEDNKLWKKIVNDIEWKKLIKTLSKRIGLNTRYLLEV